MLKRRHFTLIEVILAVVMLLITLLGVSSLYVANRRIMHQAWLQRSATWSAVEKVEDVKGTPYQSLVDLLDPESGYYEYPDENVQLSTRAAVRNASLQLVEEGGVSYLELTVTVSWNGHDVEFTSYIAEY